MVHILLLLLLLYQTVFEMSIYFSEFIRKLPQKNRNTNIFCYTEMYFCSFFIKWLPVQGYFNIQQE